MNKDTIIKVLLAIIALMVFAWLWRTISGMLIGISFGGADIFRLLYYINSKAPSGNPAFGGFRYRGFPFSSELRFRFFPFFSHPPALTSSLYFAKFAFSEILLLSKILSRTPSPTAKSGICMIMHAYTDYQRFVI